MSAEREGGMSDRVPASERYREIAGWAAEAVEHMREHDRERAAELERELTRIEQRMAELAVQERVVRMGVKLHWEAAVEALWNERWLAIGPLPLPDERAPEADHLHFDTEVGRTYRALEESLAKRSLIRRR
jgi:molybdopterin converting factor small subunit